MILRVVLLGVPLRREFDYLAPSGTDLDRLIPGIRLRVPFGKQQRIAILLALTEESTLPTERLKMAIEVIDHTPLLPDTIHQLLLESARYYHHPSGEVYETALPVLLRQGKPAVAQQEKRYQLTPTALDFDPQQLKRAPRQQQLLRELTRGALNSRQLKAITPHWRDPIKRMIEHGLVEITHTAPHSPPTELQRGHPLNREQQRAVSRIQQELNQQQPRALLVDGITGSGKTEVYLQAMEQTLTAGKQVLILVPEISLTPQTVSRFRNRFSQQIVLLHSGRSSTERLNGWIAARNGEASIIIGTRSALFTPMRRPGMIIIDEEHDSSFKQHEGFRYSARDLAILRGRRERIPVILGSATPSFESLHNARCGKYISLHLRQRAGGAEPPQIAMIDMRNRRPEGMLSSPLIDKINHHLQQQGQVLLFLNRRGYAPTLLCGHCGWSARCPRCDIHYTYHAHRRRLLCHHCGSERLEPQRCPECGRSEIKHLGSGTERIEEQLQQQFPHYSVVRIDRDTTRRKGTMEQLLEEVESGKHQLLLGTQMLAKGHHFPNVTLVAILDADGGLFGSDFRATEQMGQLITQVAGRAGRAHRRGEMVLQTHNPDHPLLQTLLQQGYTAFSHWGLEERKLAHLPPFSHFALMRAESPQPQDAHAFLREVATVAQRYHTPEVDILGPVPSPMEKRAGRYRAQLLLQSSTRSPLHQFLQQLLPAVESLKSSRRLRWSLDVDPQDML